MSESPIEQLLDAIDRLDVDAIMALVAPEVRLLAADGSRAAGAERTREFFAQFVVLVRAATHRISRQWHVDEVWIAEVDADYELRDRLQLKRLPRAFVLRTGPRGITELHVYGAHEHPLGEHRTGDEGVWVGGRWIAPL